MCGMNRYFRCLTVIVAATGIACSAYSEAKKRPHRQDIAEFPPRASVASKHFNFHVVSPGVWRSSQPSEEFLIMLKNYGLKTIVNLRRSKSINEQEGRFAKNSGIAYYYFPMEARKKQDRKVLEKILRVINDSSNQPVLIHCQAGKDRTGLISALYKLEFMNADFDDVHKEMLLYGYDEKAFPEIIRTVKSWKNKP